WISTVSPPVLQPTFQFPAPLQPPRRHNPPAPHHRPGRLQDLLELAASLLARPDFLYAATKGARGTPPPLRYVSFPEGGYYIQRSGWGDGAERFGRERFLIFDCGPLGDGGHGHYDLLNVDAY